MFDQDRFDAENTKSPFSIDHYYYSVVEGTIDREIYQSLLRRCISFQEWFCRMRFDELCRLHKGDRKYTIKELGGDKLASVLSGYIVEATLRICAFAHNEMFMQGELHV